MLLCLLSNKSKIIWVFHKINNKIISHQKKIIKKRRKANFLKNKSTIKSYMMNHTIMRYNIQQCTYKKKSKKKGKVDK